MDLSTGVVIETPALKKIRNESFEAGAVAARTQVCSYLAALGVALLGEITADEREIAAADPEQFEDEPEVRANILRTRQMIVHVEQTALLLNHAIEKIEAAPMPERGK